MYAMFNKSTKFINKFDVESKTDRERESALKNVSLRHLWMAGCCHKPRNIDLCKQVQTDNAPNARRYTVVVKADSVYLNANKRPKGLIRELLLFQFETSSININ